MPVNCGLPLSCSHLPRNFAAVESDEVAGEAAQARSRITTGVISGRDYYLPFARFVRDAQLPAQDTLDLRHSASRTASDIWG